MKLFPAVPAVDSFDDSTIRTIRRFTAAGDRLTLFVYTLISNRMKNAIDVLKAIEYCPRSSSLTSGKDSASPLCFAFPF